MGSSTIAAARSRLVRWAWVALIVAIAIAAALVARHRLGPKHLLTVSPGVLYRSGLLTPRQLEDVIDRYGIATVVNLRSELENADGSWYREQAELLARRGVRLVDLPMHSGHPPSPEVLAAWLELLDDREELPVLVHCQYGVVRTGIMVAVFQMEHLGRSAEQALEDFELFGRRALEEPIDTRVREFITGYSAGPSTSAAAAQQWPRQARGEGARGISFVADSSCFECHAEQAAAWQSSHHALSMQIASPESVLGDFGDVAFEHFGVVSRFFRKGDRFFVHTEGPDGRMAEFEIAYTFGVTPLQQYLVRFPGGRLQCLGIAWDSVKGRWFHLYPEERIRSDDTLHWTGLYQRWNLMCAECHSTDLREGYDPDDDSYRTTWAEINVGCQACHGPGAAHLEWARAKEKTGDSHGLVDAFGAPDPRSRVDACARCHARRYRVSDEDLHGRPLLDDFVPRTLDAGLYHSDGQILDEVYTYASFLQSKMYAAGVTCGDCHDPHGLTTRAAGDLLCVRCHQEQPEARFEGLQKLKKKYDSPEHHFHPQDSPAARCVACHMPTQLYMVVDARLDHSLRVPRPDLSARLGTPNACNGCHDDKSADWAATAVTKWYGPVRSRGADWAEAIDDGRRGSAGAESALIELAERATAPAIVRATALELLAGYGDGALAALRRAASDPDPLVRRTAVRGLGHLPPAERRAAVAPLLADPIRAVRSEAGRVLAALPAESLEPGERSLRAAAIAEYEAAQRTTADMPASRLNLAVLYTDLGDAERAEQSYRRAIEMDPDFLPARVNLSQLYNALGRRADAERVLRGAIERAPAEGELHYSLGLLLAERNRLDEATTALARAAELLPERARVHYNLGLALQHQQRDERAGSALERAGQLDPLDPSIARALAIFYAQRQQWRRALPHARRLVELAPGAPGPQRLLQHVEREIGP